MSHLLSCSTTLYPVGIAMWRDRAAALGWPDRPIPFSSLVSLALNSTAGWGALGPQFAHWGRLRMGHGNPQASNTGRLFFAMGVYGAANFSNRSVINVLTPDIIDAPGMTRCAKSVCVICPSSASITIRNRLCRHDRFRRRHRPPRAGKPPPPPSLLCLPADSCVPPHPVGRHHSS